MAPACAIQSLYPTRTLWQVYAYMLAWLAARLLGYVLVWLGTSRAGGRCFAQPLISKVGLGWAGLGCGDGSRTARSARDR